MKKSSLKIGSLLAVLTLVSSCGGGGGSDSGSAQRQEQGPAPVDGSNIDGHYQAKFITLNPHVNGTIPGSANFLRKEDRLFAYVRLFAGYPRAWHQQFVYTGNRCPTMNDDTNLDGFVDIAEAEAVVGKILVPMDSDISTQGSGRRFFPLGDLSGYYHYERITSFRRFLNDLQSEDKDPTDDVAKLGAGEGLHIEGRVFMALGVAETVMLPETVATKERRQAFQTLPIVCGIFSKVTGQPGRPHVDGEVVGPVASVDPDWDRPADDTIPEPTTGGASGGTTGTNDSDDGDGPVSDGSGNTHTTGGATTGGTTGSTTGGTTGRTTSGSTGGTTGETTGGTTGETTGETTGGTSGGTTGGSSSSSSTTTTTTTTTGGSSSSSSSSSTSTGSTAGGFLDSSSGV